MKLRTLLLAAALLPLIPSQAQPQNQAQPQTKSAREAARLNNLGTALMNQQFAQRAVDTFAQAYTTDPTLALAKLNQGIALLYLQQLPQAEQALTLAAAKAPSDPHAWYALGLLYRNQNQPQQSLDAFNKVLALDPTDADTHYLAASMHLELGDLDAALAEYRKALALNPIHASALFGLAHSLQRQGHPAEAHQYLVQFQRITTEKLSTPLTHTYGEEGGYGRVEVASLPVTTIAAMIPVTFRESWRTPALPAPTSGAACLLPSAADATTLVLMGAGDQAIRLFRQSNSNATFEAIPPAETNIHLPGTGLACAIGDYDNDGLPDLALALTTPSGEDQIHLLRNLGGNKFEDVTAASGITPKNHPTSLTFVDFDHDGDLDLFVTGSPTTSTPNLLWRNNGNQTFTDWTHESGLGGNGGTSGNASTGGNSGLGGSTTSAILSDLNNDRAVDLLVTGPSPAPTFFGNRRDGPFAASPLFAASLPPTTSVTTLDFDKDGWMDVLLTHTGAPGVTLWHNLDGHSFERVPLPLSDALSATAAIPIDFDNDGWIDLALLVQTSTGAQLRILRNLGPAGFTDVTAQLQLDHLPLTSPKSLLAADLRHTGAADLLLTQSDGSALLLANTGGSRNHSLHIALTGLADNKSALGTKVEVFANGLWQKWEITTPSGILAGLGTADRADLVRLLWPTGVPQDEIDLAAYKPQTVSHTGTQPKPQSITELDRRGSSCPTLFAWNGTQYTFISDVIGAAVVGHWVSPTQHNIPDPDEWIKVPGSQLHARNGTYSLRFGEPMEEVNFVDQVRLVAIDHPAATSVYPNEGFLSAPPFAQTKTIVTSSAHPLAGAWDDHGNNVLPLLSHQPLSASNPQPTISNAQSPISDPPPPLTSRHPERSEGSPHSSQTRTSPPQAAPAPTYLRDFTNLPYAGFANPHTLTLDLGPWSPNRPLLLLHGFIEYFSASSMYSAWQAGLTPIPPYIEAQLPNGSGDKTGTWQRIVDDMGFPAGLPRTVVVDLTGKLPPGTTRIRITTNLQIYWDQALVDNEAQPSNEAQPDNLRQTELPLAHADLALRGYPQQIDGHTPGDLTYNYQSISSTGPFVPHRGSYTRYGDVTPLLHAIDDQFVIFGTGEDMDLEFSAAPLPPLPTGWTRDFFFYANGFVKDMDFYEATPFAVGSLPFHGMSAYPYPATEHYPDDPAHTAYTAYQLNYNTRYESGSPTRPYQFHYQPQASTPPETNPQ
ncbi:FG-GAP-like repeat-containing protein [Tunturibacter empetritectus]|uniref:FG-GAP-like repeat-containing protein n=1 Tax=Tunturiibacter empetritectus TaxID=3069691 RepID=A0AAU7Z949_9BACT